MRCDGFIEGGSKTRLTLLNVRQNIFELHSSRMPTRLIPLHEPTLVHTYCNVPRKVHPTLRSIAGGEKFLKDLWRKLYKSRELYFTDFDVNWKCTPCAT